VTSLSDSGKLIPGETLDGYEVIRPLGQGGFGTVWLVRSLVTGSFQALKHVMADDPRLLEKELQALETFKKAASRLDGMHLVPIEHVNRLDSGLFYVMPLADGTVSTDPLDPAWLPDTLAGRIEKQRTEPDWLSSGQIIEWMEPLIEAVAALSDQGLVHRDVKPENILFINGHPCLGDISLLTTDAPPFSRRGTPGYSAPGWYLESDGHPDLWGLACTLFALLSGDPPDCMGRADHLWPPQGKDSMNKAQRHEWSFFHSLILRATNETPSERFPEIRDFALALKWVNFGFWNWGGLITMVGSTPSSFLWMPLTLMLSILRRIGPRRRHASERSKGNSGR